MGQGPAVNGLLSLCHVLGDGIIVHPIFMNCYKKDSDEVAKHPYQLVAYTAHLKYDRPIVQLVKIFSSEPDLVVWLHQIIISFVSLY